MGATFGTFRPFVVNSIQQIRRLIVLSTVMALMAAAGPAQAFELFGSDKHDKERLEAENAGLHRKIDTLETEIATLKGHQGYLLFTTALGFISGLGLFCVGLAVGMKIKKGVIQNELGASEPSGH